MTARKAEQVDHPQHYGGADNPYEAIKVIEAWDLGFCLGNTVKYISRAGKKDSAKLVEDLEKARWYLDREIARVRGLTAALNAYGIDEYKSASLNRMIERAEENAAANAADRAAEQCPDWCTVDHVKTRVVVHRADSPEGVIPALATVPGTR